VDYRAIGEIGATQLLQMIEGGTHATQTLIRPTFVERRSCGPAR
jgi:DNA-binding LacI/PurR family transcriptional regulator